MDTAFVVPRVTTDSWQLRLHGMVDKEITLSYDDLVSMPSIERMVTLTCVSNEVGGDLAGNARWQGVRIADVLAMAGPQAGADCVLSTSVDGFTVTTPLAALTDGRDALLAFAMNGEPLPLEHGFPVRMVVPGPLRVRLRDQVGRRPERHHLRRRSRPTGPSAVGPRRRRSRPRPGSTCPRDSRRSPRARSRSPASPGRSTAGSPPSRSASTTANGTTPRLSGEVSADTWRQWVYQWDATESGQHTIGAARSTRTGAAQNEQVQGVMPDGATGRDSRSVTVTA